MLPRSKRLSVEQFDLVMEKGRVAHSSLFLLRYLDNKESLKSRISAVAPQKIAKKAVERNKIRRIIYSSTTHFIDKINNIHAILIAKSPIKEVGKEEIEIDLKNLFVKAGLIK